jgi:PAS domain S-box-containing protein
MGRRAALLAAAGCAASWIIMAALEFYGFPLPIYFPGPPFASFAVLMIALVIAAAPVAQILQIHREALAAVQESEQRFRNLADTAPMLIWTSGPDRLCDFFNKRWLDFSGRSLEQELGKGWAQGVHRDDLEDCLRTSASAYDSRTEFQMEYRLRRADGEYRWVLDTNVPRITGQGRFAGYVGSAIDITDLKRTLNEVFDSQKFESLRLMTAGISHDFKNMLAGIIANAESVESEMPARAPAAGEIEIIKTTAIRAAEIIHQLSIYSGRDTGEPALVNVSDVTEEMLRLTRTLISKNATLWTEYGATVPPVLADAVQIRQVVMNLVLNASEALGDAPGTIFVRTSAYSLDAEFVRLEVSDTGRGMTEYQKSKVFDPFFTTKADGRGLELSVVRGIVHSLRGKIKVVSAPGKGAHSLFCCPRRRQGTARLALQTQST